MLIRTKGAKQGLNERKRFSMESKVTFPSLSQLQEQMLKSTVGIFPSKVTQVMNH